MKIGKQLKIIKRRLKKERENNFNTKKKNTKRWVGLAIYKTIDYKFV